MRVRLPIALMKYLPTLLQHIHLHSFVLHKQQGILYEYNWMMYEENVLILPTFIFYISAGIGQRKTLVVQESKESFPKTI